MKNWKLSPHACSFFAILPKLVKVINESNRQKPMVNATVSRIYLLDEWPFHFISIRLVKWSQSRKKHGKKGGWRCLLCSEMLCLTHTFDQESTEKCMTKYSPTWISVPWKHHSPVTVTLPDCTELPLSRAYFGYCPALPGWHSSCTGTWSAFPVLHQIHGDL